MRYQIEYQARFEFKDSVSEQQVELRLLPREDEYQKLLSSELLLDPQVEYYTYRDAYGNDTRSLSIIPPHTHLDIRLKAEVENLLVNPFNYIPPSPEEERAEIKHLLKTQVANWDFLLPSGNLVPLLSELSLAQNSPCYDPQKNLLISLQEALKWIQSEFKYEPGTTDVHCPLKEVLEKRSGVCQDFAHLFCSIVRGWGFLARYVMGYQFLEDTHTRELKSATHAWTEIYLPGAGWRGFDATHSLLTNHHYIAVAVGRHSLDAAPERGSFRGSSRGSKPEINLIIHSQ